MADPQVMNDRPESSSLAGDHPVFSASDAARVLSFPSDIFSLKAFTETHTLWFGFYICFHFECSPAKSRVDPVIQQLVEPA